MKSSKNPITIMLFTPYAYDIEYYIFSKVTIWGVYKTS